MISLSAAGSLMKSRFVKSSLLAVPAVVEFARKYRAHYFPIYLDYPVRPLPRYGWGAIPHPLLYSLIDNNRDTYASFIGKFASYKNCLQLIPQENPQDASSPYWHNLWVEGIDAVSLYAFPHVFKSNLYIEIGSGNSTKFVRRSICDNELQTQMISIDPQPRAEIDSLCDSLIRSSLEQVNVTVFDQLQSGDILMIDNSHRCFQNSSVTVV